jgi:hypothetical protein
MFSSSIPVRLPVNPLTKDKELFDQLVLVYAAIRVLQQELETAKLRITQLEST